MILQSSHIFTMTVSINDISYGTVSNHMCHVTWALHKVLSNNNFVKIEPSDADEHKCRERFFCGFSKAVWFVYGTRVTSWTAKDDEEQAKRYDSHRKFYSFEVLVLTDILRLSLDYPSALRDVTMIAICITTVRRIFSRTLTFCNPNLLLSMSDSAGMVTTFCFHISLIR